MKTNLRTLLFLTSVTLILANPLALAHTNVTAEQARDLIDSTNNLIVVDVREPYEYCDTTGHIPGALNYPWNSGVLQARYEELPIHDPVLVVCRSGGRSNQAANFLDSKGFSMVYDMLGGMSAWIWETAPCKYAGGSGTMADPYQIATAEDLILLGETPEDYNKHFILTADIDLDPNLPGGKVFDMAVIAPEHTFDDPESFGGTSFSGCFDGQGYVISNLNIQGNRYLGLFGYLDFQGVVTNLGLEAVNVNGTGSFVGGLVGYNDSGDIVSCYSTGIVNGDEDVGGLVGYARRGTVLNSYSTVQVFGDMNVGGLVGLNIGSIEMSYSIGLVAGNQNVGGLIGHDWITSRGGGSSGSTVGSFWDIQSSGQVTSAGGTGKTTAEMQTASTFLRWGTCGNEGIWTIDDGKDYPRLWWQNRPGEPIAVGATLSDILTGAGTEDSPYLIYTADELDLVGHFPCDWDKHFKLMADIDLSGFLYDTALIAPNIGRSESYFQGTAFTGVFDGNGHTISHLTIIGQGFVGLFGELDSAAEVKDLGVVDVNITGTGDYVGALVGDNGGYIITCYGTGVVSGNDRVGGLVGFNSGEDSVTITNCSFTGTVTGNDEVGGLVGLNFEFITGSSSTGTVSGNYLVGGLVGGSEGKIDSCYSSSEVNGNCYVGGFIGRNPWNDWGAITNCYSTGAVTGYNYVGGFAGSSNGSFGARITNSYSTGSVNGDENVGGFVGYDRDDGIISSFWDVETSGRTTSDGGIGKTTAEMQTADTFLNAGWDFLDETDNGTEDIWWIDEGRDYPRLWWELIPEN